MTSEAELLAALERIATVDMGGGFLGALACRKVASEAIAAWNTRTAPPAQGEAVGRLRFGMGRLVVDTGCYQQTPAVFICPVDEPGKIGASARHLGHDRHTLQPGEVVLTFPHFDQAQRVADALVNTAPPPAGGEG